MSVRSRTATVWGKDTSYLSILKPRFQKILLIDLEGINIYPNPARDKLNLEFDSEQNGVWNLVLLNSLGVASYTDRLNLEKGTHRLEIDLSAYRLSAGTYYMQLTNDSEAPRVVRVIIQ